MNWKLLLITKKFWSVFCIPCFFHKCSIFTEFLQTIWIYDGNIQVKIFTGLSDNVRCTTLNTYLKIFRGKVFWFKHFLRECWLNSAYHILYILLEINIIVLCQEFYESTWISEYGVFIPFGKINACNSAKFFRVPIIVPDSNFPY